MLTIVEIKNDSQIDNGKNISQDQADNDKELTKQKNIEDAWN